MKSVEFGQLYTLNCLVHCVTSLCTQPPYTDEDDDEEADLRIAPMISWDRAKWEEAAEYLEQTYKLCQRADVRHVFNFVLEKEEVEKMERADKLEMEGHEEIHKFYQRLQRRIEVHKTIAPIRQEIQRAIDAKKEPKVTSEQIDDVL